MRGPLSTITTSVNHGALVLMLGLFVFSIQDNIIKYFSGDYSVLQIVFLRSLIAIGIFLVIFRLSRETIPRLSHRPLLMLSRGLLGFGSYTCYYLAVASMPLAEVVSITFTMPLFVTAMSALILREQVGLRRWSAVVIGFIGVLIILSPSGVFDSLAVIFAFGAAITYATHTIITRFLGGHDHPLTIAFNTIILFGVVSGILSLLILTNLITITADHPSLAFLGRDWKMPDETDLILITVIGGVAVVGFYCLSRAYCHAEASALAPFEFSYILWAVVFGYLFWNEVPGPTTIIGVIILISSSLYIWYRERQITRREIALRAMQPATST